MFNKLTSVLIIHLLYAIAFKQYLMMDLDYNTNFTIFIGLLIVLTIGLDIYMIEKKHKALNRFNELTKRYVKPHVLITFVYFLVVHIILTLSYNFIV